MFNKLRTRLILFILGGTITSILLVSIITNVTLFREFNNYMESEQKNRIYEVIRLIENNYSLNDGWTKEGLENIRQSSIVNNFDIVIKDGRGKIIFNHKMESSMVKSHIDLMGRMGHSMMNMRNNMPRYMIDNGEYNSETYVLKLNDETIGELVMGYVGPFMISEREIIFSKGINTSIIYASLISILVAVIMGLYFSKILSKPIIKITSASNDIRNGKLDTNIDATNNITELKELSQSINHLAKSLNEQQRLRKRLTNDVAHELRTPLTILQSHTEALIDGIWEPTQERLNIFKSEISRLIKLVEELKYLVDIESHKINIENKKFNLSNTLNELIETFRYEFQNKNISLNKDIEENIYYKGDKDKISQIIINLLSNALKFTEVGKVSISTQKNKNNIEILVSDTGIGIGKEDIPYIFERLYRSDVSRNRETGGMGIGLALTKKLVEAHDGNISVESNEGVGTTFTIRLPNI